MAEALKDCTCRTCRQLRARTLPPWDQGQYESIACPTCGRHNCPHAYSHEHACTGAAAGQMPLRAAE